MNADLQSFCKSFPEGWEKVLYPIFRSVLPLSMSSYCDAVSFLSIRKASCVLHCAFYLPLQKHLVASLSAPMKVPETIAAIKILDLMCPGDEHGEIIHVIARHLDHKHEKVRLTAMGIIKEWGFDALLPDM